MTHLVLEELGVVDFVVRVDGTAVELQRPGALSHCGAGRPRGAVDAWLAGTHLVARAVPLQAAADRRGLPARPVLRPRVLILLHRLVSRWDGCTSVTKGREAINDEFVFPVLSKSVVGILFPFSANQPQ